MNVVTLWAQHTSKTPTRSNIFRVSMKQTPIRLRTKFFNRLGCFCHCYYFRNMICKFINNCRDKTKMT